MAGKNAFKKSKQPTTRQFAPGFVEVSRENGRQTHSQLSKTKQRYSNKENTVDNEQE